MMNTIQECTPKAIKMEEIVRGSNWQDELTSPRLRYTRTVVVHQQPATRRPFKRRRCIQTTSPAARFALSITTIILLLAARAHAVFINFDNCLPDSTINSIPLRLQFVPFLVDASYLPASGSHRLNLTFYGNVSGQTTVGDYPLPNDPSWNDTSNTFGKIVNVSADRVYTTLFSRYNLLTYTPYNSRTGTPFCATTLGDTPCPVAPVFYANANDPAQLRAFAVGHSFGSSYAFSTLDATITVNSGDPGAAHLACISANITPSLGNRLSQILRYLPILVLVLVAFATIFAGMFSPWGSLDPFRWTSNYGRDSDLLRLVTPGFGDCLQYLQFVVLSGSLTLQYPGFFQPVISRVSWSALMFNESFVSHGPGTQSLVDGIYVTNSTYGLGSMSQLVGMSSLDDVWAGMVIWTLVIIGCTIVICQLAFFATFIFRMVGNNAKEDLTSKNVPFTGGMLIRVVCNFFLLPIVALSMFQLVLGRTSPAYVIALAVILLVLLLLFAGWILRLILRTEPRSILFDDLPTVLLYGPLYNTYSDDAATFALIPALLTFMRGVAIGAVQPSGVAQLVILAICEVILILTVNAFKPFHSPTSMNAYHTFFGSARLAVVLLMVAFVPSMGVTEGIKGWIGYAILLLHAIVLVFGFFLNALQRVIEVAARLGGAGGEEGTGAAARGGLAVLGVRQLSRRRKRTQYGESMASNSAMMADDMDAKTIQYGTNRSRSESNNSAMLLGKQQSRTYSRLSYPADAATTPGEGDGETPYEQRTYSFLSGPSRRPDLGPTDPYYRAPRPRRQTGDMITPGAKSRSSWVTGDWANRIATVAPEPAEQVDARDSTSWPLAPLSPPPVVPSPAYRGPEEMEAGVIDPRGVDYAVRESDFYYGVRGPALSSQATRKLKTGPADPVGPASSATGWFKGVFSRKKKDSAKGFEVVRSSRVPLQPLSEDELPPQPISDRYHDSPHPSHHEAYLPGQQTRAGGDSPYTAQDEAQAAAGAQEPIPVAMESDDEDLDNVARDAFGRNRVSDIPPILGNLDLGGEIELQLPSRYSSRVSRRIPSGGTARHGSTPSVPRKSSRRLSQADPGSATRPYPRLSTTYGSQRSTTTSAAPPPRMPFTSPSAPSRNRFSAISAGDANRYSTDGYGQGDGAYAPPSAFPSEERHSWHRPTLSDASALAPPSTGDNERPTSVGYVNTYRAGESMHAGFGLAHAGSSAELVEGPIPGTVRRRSLGPDRGQDGAHYGGAGTYDV